MMPNPNESNSFDFIVKKKGILYNIEGKAFNGESTLEHLIEKGAKQSSRVLVDIIGNKNTNYITSTIKKAFEYNNQLDEIWLLKGSRLIKISKQLYNSKMFEYKFKKQWK